MPPGMMPDDRRSLTLRLSVMQYTVAVLFSLLAVAFWVFQIASHEKFREMAENNHMRRLPLPAPRGVLFDRNGTVLVENQQHVQHRAGARADEGHRPDAAHPGRRPPAWTKRSCARRSTAAGASRATGRSCSSRTPRFEQLAAFMARQWELPGIITQQVPTRRYPPSAMAAHLFGYVGEVTEVAARRARSIRGSSRARSSGRRASSRRSTRYLMGADGDEVRRRQQPRPRDRRACARSRRSKVAASSSPSTPTCRRRRRTASVTTATTAPPSCSIRARAKCCRS